jgi:hypothetical protein
MAENEFTRGYDFICDIDATNKIEENYILNFETEKTHPKNIEEYYLAMFEENKLLYFGNRKLSKEELSKEKEYKKGLYKTKMFTIEKFEEAGTKKPLETLLVVRKELPILEDILKDFDKDTFLDSINIKGSKTLEKLCNKIRNLIKIAIDNNFENEFTLKINHTLEKE